MGNSSYQFICREQIEIKGLGRRTTYFVEDQNIKVVDTHYPTLKKVTNVSTGQSDISVLTQGSTNVFPALLPMKSVMMA